MSPQISLQGMLSGDAYRLLIQNYYYINEQTKFQISFLFNFISSYMSSIIINVLLKIGLASSMLLFINPKVLWNYTMETSFLANKKPFCGYSQNEKNNSWNWFSTYSSLWISLQSDRIKSFNPFHFVFDTLNW